MGLKMGQFQGSWDPGFGPSDPEIWWDPIWVDLGLVRQVWDPMVIHVICIYGHPCYGPLNMHIFRVCSALQCHSTGTVSRGHGPSHVSYTTIVSQDMISLGMSPTSTPPKGWCFGVYTKDVITWNTYSTCVYSWPVHHVLHQVDGLADVRSMKLCIICMYSYYPCNNCIYAMYWVVMT